MGDVFVLSILLGGEQIRSTLDISGRLSKAYHTMPSEDFGPMR